MQIGSSQQESIFFHFILDNQLYLNNTKSEFFTNATLKELFDIAKEHAIRYKEAPSKDQVISLIKIKGLGEKLSDDILSAVYNVKTVMDQYDNEWLEQNVGAWIQIRNLDYVMRKAIAHVKTSKITVDNAAEINETIRHMMMSETSIDFNFSRGSDFFNPQSHSQQKLARTSSGYDYIDLCLKGGYWKGSLIVFLGGAKCGKSIILGNLASRSIQLGFNTAYITLELQESLVTMRIGANLLSIPINDYEEVSKDQDLIKRKINDLQQSSLNKFGVFDIKEFATSTASANDIAAYLKKMEEMLNIKFDNIFIDYINIMKNWRNPNSENTYMKIKQICEDLSAMGKTNNWAVISCTQTNKDGLNNPNLQLSNVSESIGLLQTVDVLFGIATNPTMKAQGEYYIICLADRVSSHENTKKRFTIDWKYMRIAEDKGSPIQDMDAFINNYNNPTPKTPRYPTSQSTVAATIGTKQSNINPIEVTGNALFE